MTNVIEARDPRGWTVFCTEAQWERHVLAARSWMAGWEDDVKTAIEKPVLPIFQDADFEDRHIYYGPNHRGKDRYMKVVVVVKEEGLAEVITAFPTDSAKSGEKML